MGTYAAPADLVAYVQDDEDIELPDAGGIDRYLTRAERDVDRHLAWAAPIAAGPRIAPGLLTGYERDALKRATCAQAQYLIQRGWSEQGFVEGIAAVEGITFAEQPRLGPLVEEELAGAGLLRRSGTAAPTPPDDADG